MEFPGSNHTPPAAPTPPVEELTVAQLHARARQAELMARRDLHREAGRKQLTRLLEWGRQYDRWLDGRLDRLHPDAIASLGHDRNACYEIEGEAVAAFGLSRATLRRAAVLWDARAKGLITPRDLYGAWEGGKLWQEPITLEVAEVIAQIRCDETWAYRPRFVEGAEQRCAGEGNGQ